MKTPRSKGLIKYGISFGIGITLAFLYVIGHADLSNTSATAQIDWYRILCDAFAIPGFLFLCLGLMMTLTGQGALDGFSYVLVYAGRMLLPGAAKKKLSYWDFVEEKRQKRHKGYGFLYVTGLVCMGAALIFLYLFNCLYS